MTGKVFVSVTLSMMISLASSWIFMRYKYNLCTTSKYLCIRQSSINKRILTKAHCASSSTTSSNINFKCLNIKDVDGNIRNVHYIDVGPIQENIQSTKRPIVIIGGTAQTISTYMPHIKALAKTRRVLMPELRCQGIVTDLDPKHATMHQYVNDFIQILENLSLFNRIQHNTNTNSKDNNDNLETQIDLIGFSFGGRVSMAVAAKYPHLVSHLSITGVPYVRPKSGIIIINQWKELLAQKKYQACAESFIEHGYHGPFLEKIREKLNIYTDMILSNNNMTSIYQLLQFSHCNNPLVETEGCKAYIPDIFISNTITNTTATVNSHTYSVVTDTEIDAHIEYCSNRIQCKTQIVAGLYDKIAGYEEVKELSYNIENSTFFELKTGHLVPFEDPISWRKLVMEFLHS